MTTKNNIFIISLTLIFISVFLLSWGLLANKKFADKSAISQPLIIQLTSTNNVNSSKTASPTEVTASPSPSVAKSSTKTESSNNLHTNNTEVNQNEPEDEEDD